jgi:hypothetical protein
MVFDPFGVACVTAFFVYVATREHYKSKASEEIEGCRKANDNLRDELRFYEEALWEIDNYGYEPREEPEPREPKLWSRSLSECKGDEIRAVGRYVRLRKWSLQREHEKEKEYEKEKRSPVKEETETQQTDRSRVLPNKVQDPKINVDGSVAFGLTKFVDPEGTEPSEALVIKTDPMPNVSVGERTDLAYSGFMNLAIESFEKIPSDEIYNYFKADFEGWSKKILAEFDGLDGVEVPEKLQWVLFFGERAGVLDTSRLRDLDSKIKRTLLNDIYLKPEKAWDFSPNGYEKLCVWAEAEGWKKNHHPIHFQQLYTIYKSIGNPQIMGGLTESLNAGWPSKKELRESNEIIENFELSKSFNDQLRRKGNLLKLTIDALDGLPDELIRNSFRTEFDDWKKRNPDLGSLVMNSNPIWDWIMFFGEAAGLFDMERFKAIPFGEKNQIARILTSEPSDLSSRRPDEYQNFSRLFHVEGALPVGTNRQNLERLFQLYFNSHPL